MIHQPPGAARPEQKEADSARYREPRAARRRLTVALSCIFAAGSATAIQTLPS